MELLDIVNESDEVVGIIPRKEVTNQITRNVVVLLRDNVGNHILQVRAQHIQ